MKKHAILYVNIAVLLFGAAGLFAKWIHLPAIGITFGRVFFSSLALLIYILISKRSLRLKGKKDLLLMICAGIVLGLHWWAFMTAIQISTVAIGTITFATFPLFVTFLEPVVFHRKLTRRNVFIALIILIGVCITIPELSLKNNMVKGIILGMSASLGYAVLTLLNKELSERYSATVTAFYEQATATIILLPFVLRAEIHPAVTDILLLLFLGIVMTAIAHTLFITSLKDIPAQLAGICSSMETVYGILLALILLGEVPSVREIIGAVIIIGAVVYAQIRSD